jgi:dTDP-4-amino-4,6-dideoxygalactose transaminase
MPPFDEYVAAIRGLWGSRWLTNAGGMHEQLTAELKNYLDVKNFLLFSNGHMALELGIQALGLSGEVITTPYTFVSTTQAIVRNGLTPVFCDIDPARFAIDPGKIEPLITEKTSAIVAGHVYGIPCDVDGIDAVARKHSLKVIYDAAHAFGVRYKGKSIAGYGDYSMFSFHATKVFHTAEGGGVVFGDDGLCDRLRHLRDFGLCPGGLDADEIGLNAKLSEFHAAMGLCNLRHFAEEVQKRKLVSERYDNRLKGVSGLRLLSDLSDVERNYSYYPVVLLDGFGKSRDEVCEALQKRGIMARKYFYPLTSDLSCYNGVLQPCETPIARDIANRVLCLPLYADMTVGDVGAVCDALLGCKT